MCMCLCVCECGGVGVWGCIELPANREVHFSYYCMYICTYIRMYVRTYVLNLRSHEAIDHSEVCIPPMQSAKLCVLGKLLLNFPRL